MDFMQTFLIILAGVLAVFGLFGLGFLIPARSYRPHAAPSDLSQTLPFRPDLPEPVRRHFRDALGDPAPRMDTAVVWGRAKLHINGIWFPMRWKAWYRPGEAFHRQFEITWFQRRILRGYDYYRDGEGAFVVSGKEERGAPVDESQNLALWAEGMWMPSVFVHSPAARWEGVDEHTARLAIPFQSGRDELLAHFDPLTGRMSHLSALRYSVSYSAPNRTPSMEKEPWRVDLLEWRPIEGVLLPCHISVAWGEAGAPWSYWWVEGAAYNVDVSDKLG